MSKSKTIIIGQGGGPTAVINDQVAGALYEAQRNGYRVFGMRNGLEGLLNAHIRGNIFEMTSWNPEDVRLSPPGAVLYSTRINLTPKKGSSDANRRQIKRQIETIRENMESLGVHSIAYFGGNDSSAVLQSIGIGVHGAKTVDNDLFGAHHVSGFGSAALFNAINLKNLPSDIGSFSSLGPAKKSFSTGTVLVYQTMGRDTGWLALATAFAKVDQSGTIAHDLPPDIIWPREVPFDKLRYLDTLSNTLARREGKAVIVIGEELVEKVNGKEIPLSDKYGKDTKDSHGHAEHGRAGSFSYAHYLASLAKELKIANVAVIKETPIAPQHLQRCYKSHVDAWEAYEVGRETVRAIADGQEQVSVVLQKIDGMIRTARIPIGDLAGRTRRVPLEDIRGIRGPSDDFIREYLPTIGGAKALPHYKTLDLSRIVALEVK